MIANFEGLEPWRCEDIKAMAAPEFRDFRETGPRSYSVGMEQRQLTRVLKRGRNAR